MPTGGGVLSQNFVVPPFTSLDAKQGYWQQRKREWASLVGDSGAGRGEGLTFGGSSSSSTIGPKGSACAPDLTHRALHTFLRRRARIKRHPSTPFRYPSASLRRAPSEYPPNANAHSYTSLFDPVLMEALCKWFCPRPSMVRPPNRPVVVIDPFAGGTTRGIVAAYHGLMYIGVDISEPQV